MGGTIEEAADVQGADLLAPVWHAKNPLTRLFRMSVIIWWTTWDSNPRPPHCERGALPTELVAHYHNARSHTTAPCVDEQLQYSRCPPAELDPSLLEKMRDEWDRASHRKRPAFYRHGQRANGIPKNSSIPARLNVFFEVLTDLGNVCQGKSAKEMNVLEIGCGAGRMTRALSEVFGQVYAVDVSGEMIARPKKRSPTGPMFTCFRTAGPICRFWGM